MQHTTAQASSTTRTTALRPGPTAPAGAANSSTTTARFDEFSSLEGGRQTAVLTFRTPDPAPLTALAGTTREAEAAWQLEQGELSGRETITVRSRARVDADQVRAARTGEATLIAGGRAGRVRIIKTNSAPAVREVAWELVAGLTRPRPAGALGGDPSQPTEVPAGPIAGRELPGPDQPPQGPSAPPGRPSAGLDPAGPGPVRRYRPPGSGGEAVPSSDRAKG